MATIISVSFTETECLLAVSSYSPTKVIKVSKSEYYTNAHKNFDKVVLVVSTSSKGQRFWNEKVRKSVIYFGFKNLIEKHIKVENIRACLDGVDVSKLHAILEVGEKPPGFIKCHLSESLKHKVIFVALPGGIPIVYKYDIDIWPEKCVQETLVDEIEEWIKNNENSNIHSARDPPSWVVKARTLCGISEDNQTESKKLCFVYNPISGLRRSKEMIDKVTIPILRQLGFQHFDIHVSEYSGHCEKLVAELDLTRYDALLTFGGDGSQAMTFRGLMNNESYKSNKYGSLDFPVGVVPTGTGCWLFSGLDENIIPLKTPGERDVIDATLGAASLGLFEYPSVEYTAEGFTGDIERGVSPIGSLFGNINAVLQISDVIREVDDTLGMLRYQVATSINMLQLQQIPCCINYLPFDSDIEPNLDDWRTGDGWESYTDGAMDIMIMGFLITDHPRKTKREMQERYFYLMFNEKMNREKYMKSNFISSPYWVFYTNPPDGVHVKKVKAAEIVFPDLDVDERYVAALNLDGEVCQNVKRFRAVLSGTNLKLLDIPSAQEAKFTQLYK